MRAKRLVVVAFVLSIAGGAAAQSPSADDLFRQGTQLFSRGETKAACERFDASYRMDAAPGTLFNLAACHEKDGLLWRARAEFLDFIDRANKVGKADKAKPAVDHVAAIEARLPKLQLVFPPQSNALTIALDGVALAHDQWQAAIPVDSGAHTLEFQAPDTVAATRSVTAGSDAAIVRVDVPVLDPMVAAAPAPVPVATLPEPVVVPPPRGSRTRPIGMVVGGVGVVALGLGGYFGLHALSQKSDADSACGGQKSVCPTSPQTSAAQADLDSARTSATLSTIGLGVGAIAVGVGAYLIFKPAPAPDASAAAKDIRVIPSVGPGGGGVSVAGIF